MKKEKLVAPMKFCPRCRHEFPLTARYWRKDATARNGFQGWCKSCAKEVHREHYIHFTERDVEIRGNIGVKCPLYSPKCVQCTVLADCWRLSNIESGGVGMPLVLKRK